jgi:hypothetical protein
MSSARTNTPLPVSPAHHPVHHFTSLGWANEMIRRALAPYADADMLAICGEAGIAFVPFFAVTGDRREAGGVRRPATSWPASVR